MGFENWTRILENIILNNLKMVNEDSIHYEKINHESFNIYFQKEYKSYSMCVELNSGINIHLRYLNKFSGKYETDPIMNVDLQKQINKIKIKTLLNNKKRLEMMTILFCNKINSSNN